MKITTGAKVNRMEKEILGKLSRGECYQHIHWLYTHAPERLSATPAGEKAVEYIRNTLKGYGLEPRVFDFSSIQSLPGEAEIRLLQPTERKVEATAMSHIPSTPAEGIGGEVVYVGNSGEADYAGKNVQGKITLARLGYTPAFCEKVRLAEKHGASAQIQMNWGLEEQGVMSHMMARSVWGNPTPETISLWPKIPAVTITKKDGELLRRLLESGEKVVLRLKASADTGWKKIHLVEAQIRGKGPESEQFVLLGGHLDAWGSGVTCNATGNSTLLEMARIFYSYRDSLPRSLRICFWPGHEDIMAGSTWYVDHFWEDLREHCILYMNTDSTGMKEASHYMSRSTEEAEEFHRQTIRDLFGEKIPYQYQRASKIGDQSFFGIGIPSIMGRMVHSPELQKEWNHATLGWWYHSAADDLNALDMDVFEYTLKGYAVTLYRLLTLPLLPFDIHFQAKILQERLEELARKGEGVVDLSSVLQFSQAFSEKAQKLNTGLKKGMGGKKKASVNQALMQISRLLLPVSYTYWGVYEQDLYGAEYLSKPFPGLYWLERVARLPRDSEEFLIYETRLIRERNKIHDAFQEANLILDRLFAPW